MLDDNMWKLLRLEGISKQREKAVIMLFGNY